MRNSPANRFFLILTLASILLAPNCATITRKSKQRIPVTSTPVGAAVFVNGVQQGVTPLVLRLPRKEKIRVIRIESAGYHPVEIRAKREVSTDYVIADIVSALLIGYPIGLILYMMDDNDMKYSSRAVPWALSAAVLSAVFMLADFGSERAYEFSPSELEVTLTKTDGTPRVDTIIVDNARFADLKWIRVRRD